MLLPPRIGRYQIEKEIGRGASGVVFKAHDPNIDRTVAIKLVHAEYLSGEDRESYLARFGQEARLAGRCVHPNIVLVYDFATHRGNPFLVMEYVHGTNLAEEFRRGVRFERRTAVQLTIQVLNALGSAHKVGVIHRDIKPGNIILLPNQDVKVTDFGIARLDQSEFTRTRTIIGTPSYMSPEQARGEEPDLRTDIFSTGTVLFELLTGYRPFAGESELSIMYKIVHEPPATSPQIAASLPWAIRSVVERALAKRPQDRFGSATEMASALAHAAELDPHPTSAAAAQAPQSGPISYGSGYWGETGDHRTPSDPQGPTAPPAPGDGSIITAIERWLLACVGPIARNLFRRAVSDSSSPQQLSSWLEKQIDEPERREAFRTGVQNLIARRSEAEGGATPSVRMSRPIGNPSQKQSFSPEEPGNSESQVATQAELERLQRDLAQALGPIAATLVRRIAKENLSGDKLRAKLATHIEDPVERANFLRRTRAGGKSQKAGL